MAELTSVTKYATVQGPIKVEYVQGTMAASGDTYSTLMQRPLFAFGSVNSVTATHAELNFAVSGKTVTITVAAGANVVNFCVVGF